MADRLFLALRPDAAAATRIHQLGQRLREVYGLEGRPLSIERLHVTLCFLGEYDSLSPELLATAHGIAAQAVCGAPFELRLDRVMSFVRYGGDAPLVLCREDDCAPLTRLHHALAAAAARTGLIPADPRGFKPHVTLLYDAKMITLQEVEPFAWTATEVLLIRSHIGRGRHDVLGRYPLR